MGNSKFIEYTKRNDDLGRAQVVQEMAVRELSNLKLVIISGLGPFLCGKPCIYSLYLVEGIVNLSIGPHNTPGQEIMQQTLIFIGIFK